MKRLLRQVASKFFRTVYAISRLCGIAGGLFGGREPTLDLLFVVEPRHRGWILDGIAKEIARYFPGRCSLHYHYTLRSIPAAKAYFFVHYATVVDAYKLNPLLWRKKVFVWYTHPRDYGIISEREILYILKKVDLVFCTCPQFVNLLRCRGLASHRTICVLGGADPSLFLPHRRGSGKIGFCSFYYPRKAPDRILEIVKRMPHRKFLLVGRLWERYKRFGELRDLPNFEYIEVDYRDYPALYAQMDVFVSASTLEGGPISLIEAMMSNVVPVASRTGFAPDVIRHGENGYLFETDAPVEVVCDLIERAMVLPGDIRATVLHCSWDAFSARILNLMGFDAEYPESCPRDT
jgi:glycosyltransferase involved in cell wall biosynthesis